MGKFLDAAPKGKFLDEAPAEVKDRVPTADEIISGTAKGSSLISRIPSANREFLRSIGTGEDKADAYMRGLNEPGKSETFQNQLLRQTNEALPEDSSVLTRFLAGIPGSTAGLAADIVTDPVAAILTAAGDIKPGQVVDAFKSGGKAIQSGTKSLLSQFSGFKKPSPEAVKEMISRAESESTDFHQVINRAQAADEANITAQFTTLKNNLKNKLDVFLGKVEAPTPKEVTIPKLADEATLANRENYIILAKDVSDRYGAAYTNAIGKSKIDIQDLHNALGEAVEEAGLLAKPEAAWSPSEKKIMDYYNSVGKNLPSGNPTIKTVFEPSGPVRKVMSAEPMELDVAKVDQDLQRILQSRAGKQYGPGDHILTLVRERMSGVINNPNIAVVRAKFKPVLQMKNEAYKIFDPFNRSGSFDTTKGINFFSRYVNAQLKPDELRLVQGMKQKFGDEIFKSLDDAAVQKNEMLKGLSDLDTQHQAKLAGVQSAHDEARAKTMMDSESHLSLLDSMLKDSERTQATSDLIKKLALGGAKVATGGTLAGMAFKKGEEIMSLLS